MAIAFHPKAGTVLVCDFRGYEAPEIIKVRPVVVISAGGFRRPGLVTVVPISARRPDPVQAIHVALEPGAVPGIAGVELWAKCDLVAAVSHARLDRIRLGRGAFATGQVSPATLQAIRLATALSIGIAPESASR